MLSTLATGALPAWLAALVDNDVLVLAVTSSCGVLGPVLAAFVTWVLGTQDQPLP